MFTRTLAVILLATTTIAASAQSAGLSTTPSSSDLSWLKSGSLEFFELELKKALSDADYQNALQILEKRTYSDLKEHMGHEDISDMNGVILVESYNTATGLYDIQELYAGDDDSTYYQMYWFPDSYDPEETRSAIDKAEVAEITADLPSTRPAIIPDIILNISMVGVPKMSKKDCREMYTESYENTYTLKTYYNRETQEMYQVLEYPPAKVKFKVKNIKFSKLTGG